MSDIEPVDDADEIKDFAYYAELAEEWLAEAERFTPQIYNPRKFDHAMRAADVCARLAEAATRVAAPRSHMIWRHANGQPCTDK